jgi:chaperone required for assembly of F1-ATPase
MTMIFRHVASEIDRPVQHLLEENNQLLHQIETNILTFQAQNNIDLFHRARRNINDLLHITTQLPGMSTKMPPLRVSVNEGLASFVLPGISMDQILGSSHLKEEPRGW